MTTPTKRPVGHPKRPDDGRPRYHISVRLTRAEYVLIRDNTDVDTRRRALLEAAEREDDGMSHLQG